MVAVAVAFPRSWRAPKGSLITRYRGMRRASGTITSMGAWPSAARCVNSYTTKKSSSSRLALRTE
jgi:hypothetical protein